MQNEDFKNDVIKSLTAESLSRAYNFQLPNNNNGNIKCFDNMCGEKKPTSMSVKTDGQFFYTCHRCGLSGDALSVIGHFESLDCKSDFKKILEKGASIGGVQVPVLTPNKKTPKIKAKNNFDIWVESRITTDKSIIDKVRKDYFELNNIKLENFSEIKYVVDRGHGEFVFPVHNETGKRVGYQRGAKHLVESSTHAFFYNPRKINFSDDIYLVEGLSDYLSMIEAGLTNTIAITSVVVKLGIISEIFKKIPYERKCKVCLDYDGWNSSGEPRQSKTGFPGAKKALAIKKNSPKKASLFFVSTKKKKDINDLYVEEGAVGLKKFFNKKQSINLNKLSDLVSGEDRFSEASIADIILDEKRITFSSGDFWDCEKNIWKPVDSNIVEGDIMQTIQNRIGINHTKKIIQNVAYYLKIKTMKDSLQLTKAITQNETYFNKYKNHIFMKNGKWNLKEDRLEDYLPEDYITSTLQISPKNKSDHRPEWDKFINSIFEGDEDKDGKIKLIQQIMGYCLYPHAPFHKLFIFIGGGGNGKGVLANVISDMVGDSNFTNMGVSELEKDPYAMSNLQGKYINFGTEGKKGESLESPSIKKLTGGDIVTARAIYKKGFEFRPYAKQIFSMNDEPHVGESADWLVRRLIMIPFNNNFDQGVGSSGRQGDVNLSDKLRKERIAIFWWAIEGLKGLLEDGEFFVPKSVRTKTMNFIKSHDMVLDFYNKKLKRKVVSHGTSEFDVRETYQDYRNFCTEDEGISKLRVLKRLNFCRRLVTAVGKGNCEIKNTASGEVFAFSEKLTGDKNGFEFEEQPGFKD